MELRTRADQRELDISRVTLRETGRELQKSGSDLRAGHIDRSIDINIRRQAAGGARRTADGRGTIAESSSPDVAYVLRTLPPDLRKHWDSLPEARQREIIEKASASANRKESGTITAVPEQKKNRVRRIGNTMERMQENSHEKRSWETGSYAAAGNPRDMPDRRENRSRDSGNRKPKTVYIEEADSNPDRSILQEHVRREIQEEAEGPIRIRQRSQRMEQAERNGGSAYSSQESDRKTGNQTAGHILPESGYVKRIAGRKTRIRNNPMKEPQTPEIKIRSGSEIRTNGNGIQTRTKGRTDDRSSARTAGKEYGKRQSLKKLERASEETTGLRIIDNNVEDETELRITTQAFESRTGLRTTERKPERSAELRIAGTIPGMAEGELRTLQTGNNRKVSSGSVKERDTAAGPDKVGTQRSQDPGKALVSSRSKKEKNQGRSVTASERKEKRGDQRKQINSRQESGIERIREQKKNSKSRGKGDSEEGEASAGDRELRESSPETRRTRRSKNTSEEAAPSQGNKSSAVHLIRRKKKDGSSGGVNKHFVSSFTNLVKADFARTGQITQERKRAQVEGSLQEYQDETTSQAIRIAVTPLRIAAKKAARAVVKKIVTAIVSATTAVINMLLPALVLLLPVLLIAAILPGLMGSLVAEEEEGAGYNVNGGSIVEYARQWIGKTKYIYGAGRNGPLDWQDYADCSSFVHGVFSHFGVEIGWTTVEQENSGTKVCENSLSKAEPGDIVLFYDGGSIRSGGSGHVGIYSGSGNMVHNSSSKGTVVEAPVSYQNRPYVVRRITIPFTEDRSGGGGNATKGHRKDPTNYSQSQLELIWAIVAQEDNGSYKGALAVISSAMNRTESSKWGYCGRTAMEQLTAPGQYCYSNDTYWMARLGGNVPDYVKTAVNDCLKKGIRNHNHTSFRSTKGKVTGPDAVQIGGNWFFDY